MTQHIVSPLAPALRKLQHWGAFSDRDRDALLALPHTLRVIEPQGYIVREGDRPTQSCVLRSGFAFRHKIVADGARQICSIQFSGDLMDIQNSFLEVADHNVQALTRCEIAYVARDDLKRIAIEHPTIGQAMWLDTLVDGSIFMEWMTNIGRRDGRARIAHLLCEFAVRLQGAGLNFANEYELPMTQEQIGDCTGLTSVHVNRMLKSLINDGLITRTKRAVKIENWKRLARAGDFESAYLHMSPDRPTMIQ